MEEDGREKVAVGVNDAGNVKGSPATHAKRHRLVLALVDELLVGGGQNLLSLGDAAVAVGIGLDLALPGMGLDALQARGNLGRGVGDHVDLEGQGQHVVVDFGAQEAGAVGGGLALLEDIGERLEGAFGHGDGGVVEGVAHGGRIGAKEAGLGRVSTTVRWRRLVAGDYQTCTRSGRPPRHLYHEPCLRKYLAAPTSPPE